MAAKKTTKKRTTKKATKSTAPVNARRVGPERLAEAAWARGSDFWAKMVRHGMSIQEGASRVAQVEPRQTAH